MSACDECLRRTWLIAELAAEIECAADRARRPVASVLELEDADLLRALAGSRRSRLRAAHAAFAAGPAREHAQAAGLGLCCRCDAGYPEGLAHLPDPPAVLHVAGAEGVPRRSEDAVAIVGARRATEYGTEVARRLARDLGSAGVVVVSGMALGCDSAAHAGCLEADGVTVAVLAGGPDRAYPASKRALHERVRRHGCVVSEMPPGFRARRWCFVARNRIIAGLAHMTVVVEAADRSGSLITAARARDLGREVGAIPGRVTSPAAAGANSLLADGAVVVRDARDVLDAMYGAGARPAPPDRRAGLGTALRGLLDELADGRDTVSALARGPDDLGRVRSALGELELLGHVRREPGGRYVPLA